MYKTPEEVSLSEMITLVKKLINWRDKQQFTEDDNPLDDLHFESMYNLTEIICEVIGYYEYGDNE